MKSKFLFAGALCLCAAVIAPAQTPTSGTPVTVSPLLSSTPSFGTPVTTSGCLTGKCATDKVPCTPEVKPAKKTVYSTVTRDYCVPTRSLFDTIMKKCGLSDECDGSIGETHTKTLLVKKQVPKCEEPLCTKQTETIIEMPALPSKISAIPPR